MKNCEADYYSSNSKISPVNVNYNLTLYLSSIKLKIQLSFIFKLVFKLYDARTRCIFQRKKWCIFLECIITSTILCGPSTNDNTFRRDIWSLPHLKYTEAVTYQILILNL